MLNYPFYKSFISKYVSDHSMLYLYLFFCIAIVVQDEERLKAEEEGEELSLPESKEDNPPHTPSENGDILTPTTPDKELNPKDPVTLSWEETKLV